MKTLTAIVQDHIDRTAALAGDPERMMAEAQRFEARMAKRLQADPALSMFVRHYAEGLAMALPVLPPAERPFVIKSLLMQIVVAWEDVHQEYGQQMKPTP